MLTPNTRLVPNEKDIAAKVLEGEAIIINLSNGIYYSMDKVGGFIWEQIAAGQTLDEIATLVSQRYEVSTEIARTDLERLAAQLLEERIVQPGQGERLAFDPPTGGQEGRSAYEPPKLEIYRDIGHLFALDPPMPGLRNVSWNAPAPESSPEPRS